MKKLTEEQIEKFKFLIEEKEYTQKMAAIEVGMPVKSTTHYINSRNIIVRNKNRKYLVNDYYFDEINTETKAYILGFFLADGTIEKGQRADKVSQRICFSNSIDDQEVIIKVRDEISPNSKISIRNRSTAEIKRKDQIELRIGSDRIVECLEKKYGIHQRKTYNSEFKFNFDNIPEHLVRHFIRGYFDGDGSVSFYFTKKSFYFSFSFVFNSLDFTNQIADIFVKLFDIKSVIYEKIGKTATWYALRFDYSQNRTEKIKQIYKYFYRNSSIFLSRKKKKFDEYLEYRANSEKQKVQSSVEHTD